MSLFNPFSMLSSAIGSAMMGGAAQSPFLKVLGAATGANPFAVDTTKAVGSAVQGAVDLASLDPSQAPAPVASQAPQQPVVAPTATSGDGPVDYTPVIIQAAQRYGVDPRTALKVAGSEGGVKGWKQSLVKKGDEYEPSFGPFQLLVGDGVKFPKGMGNQFMEETGLDPRDPANAEAAIDFAMKQASKLGWGQWYGAAKVGVGKFDGIGGKGNGQSFDYAQAKGAKAGAYADPAVSAPNATPQAGGRQGNAIDRVLAALAPTGTPSGATSPTTTGASTPAVTPDMTPGQRVMATITGGAGAGARAAGQPQPMSPMDAPAAVDLGEEEIAALQQSMQQRSMTPSQRAAERKQRLTAATRHQRA